MTSSERNIGIELLRIFAMLMIVGLHITGKGWIFQVDNTATINSYITHNISVFFMCCINCYALITGFFLYKKDYVNDINNKSGTNFSKIFELWFRVIVYSITIAIIGVLFANQNGTIRYWYQFITPVYHNCYWYITAYFGLYIMKPIIAIAINQQKLKLQFFICWTIFIFFSILPMLFKDRFIFNLYLGMSCIWLIVMAYVGGVIHHLLSMGYKLKIRNIVYLFLIINIFDIIIYCIANYFKLNHILTIHHFANHWWVAPVPIINSVLLLIIFYNISIKNNAYKKIITIFSMVTLDVYLLHMHPLCFNDIFSNQKFKINITTMPTLKMLLLFLGLLLGIYMAGSITGLIRQQIFKLLKIKELSQFINGIFQKFCMLVLKFIKKLLLN